MKNENETKKILLGCLIAGVAGAGILYTVYAARHKKPPLLKKIGKTIAEVGEMLENCDVGHCSEVVENIENKTAKGADVFTSLTNWLSNGLALWDTLKKG